MELHTTNNQVLIPATQYIKEIKDMQSPNFSWAKDNTLWERVDVTKTDIGVVDTGTRMIKICHLLLVYGYTITYSQDKLDKCTKICHTCYTYPDPALAEYNCLCNKVGSIQTVKENWLKENTNTQQGAKNYGTFALQNLLQEPNEYEDTSITTNETPNQIRNITQDTCEFQVGETGHMETYSCITNKKLLNLVYKPLRNILKGKLSIFDSDTNTIFNERNLNNTIKRLHRSKEQELSSSTRDMIIIILLG